jgi:acetolactate synthase-1/2/3 large subunit
MADFRIQRQNGPQEVDIIPMASPVTKYAVTISDPTQILIELETAWAHATQGRPGPVWLNIPLDVQAAIVDESSLAHAQLEPAPVIRYP